MATRPGEAWVVPGEPPPSPGGPEHQRPSGHGAASRRGPRRRIASRSGRAGSGPSCPCSWGWRQAQVGF